MGGDEGFEIFGENLSVGWRFGDEGLVEAVSKAGVDVDLEDSKKIITVFEYSPDVSLDVSPRIPSRSYNLCVPFIGETSVSVDMYVLKSSKEDGLGVIINAERDAEGKIVKIEGGVSFSGGMDVKIYENIEKRLREYFCGP